MASREEYNACMRPFMTGTKTKQERQHDMCIGAKICSGKAKNEQEAEAICSVPKLPKWAKQLVPKGEQEIGCEARMARAVKNLADVSSSVKSGKAEELRTEAAVAMDDIYACIPDPVVMEMAADALNGFNDISKRFYFKGEGKDVLDSIATLLEVLS